MSVTEEGMVFLAVQSKTDHESFKIKAKTIVGEAVFSTFLFEPLVANDCKGATVLSPEERVNQVLVIQKQALNSVVLLRFSCQQLRKDSEVGLQTLRAMHNTSPSDCPTYRFKEWTSHDKSGLER